MEHWHEPVAHYFSSMCVHTPNTPGWPNALNWTFAQTKHLPSLKTWLPDLVQCVFMSASQSTAGSCSHNIRKTVLLSRLHQQKGQPGDWQLSSYTRVQSLISTEFHHVHLTGESNANNVIPLASLLPSKRTVKNYQVIKQLATQCIDTYRL